MLCESEKAAKEYTTSHLEEFELPAFIIWCRIADVFQNYLTENLTEVHITNKKFTCATAKVNELFITNEYRSDVITAFNWTSGPISTVVQYQQWSSSAGILPVRVIFGRSQ